MSREKITLTALALLVFNVLVVILFASSGKPVQTIEVPNVVVSVDSTAPMQTVMLHADDHEHPAMTVTTTYLPPEDLAQ